MLSTVATLLSSHIGLFSDATHIECKLAHTEFCNFLTNIIIDSKPLLSGLQQMS